MKIIAVTGNLSSGKSTVCHIFQQLGAHVTSSDSIVHKLLDPQTPLGEQIIDLLGKDVLQEGQFNKQKIASLVFTNQELLKKYEHLIHPIVLEKIKNEAKSARKHLIKLFVVEVPLLFESKMEAFFDHIIVVSAPFDLCKDRFIKKHGTSANTFDLRYKRQMPLKKKEQKAGFIIDNRGTKQELRTKVERVLNQF